VEVFQVKAKVRRQLRPVLRNAYLLLDEVRGMAEWESALNAGLRFLQA
jgi:hypothetical protein